MDFLEANKKYEYIESKSTTIGATIKDYYALKKLCNIVSKQNGQDWYKLKVQIYHLMNEIYNLGILHKFSEEDLNYILKKCYLLPLILANNIDDKIEMYSDNSYRFICQSCGERALGITDYKNLFSCSCCDNKGNAVYYLMSHENLVSKDAIQLLAQIYLLDVKSYNKNLEPLVQKYQQSILSSEYLRLLKIGYERFKKRKSFYFNNYGYESLDEMYEERYETIERIKNNEYDNNFNYEGPKKLVIIQRVR